MSLLILRYRYDASFFDPALDRDDFGLLTISVETERFGGQGDFWVQWQDVREFGDALAAYPLDERSPVVAQWGYNQQEGEDLILRLEIAPANKVGDLVVRFEIADQHEPRERVRGSFRTNYLDIDAFRSAIAQLMDNKAEQALLRGR
jgi:hypothetical protein